MESSTISPLSSVPPKKPSNASSVRNRFDTGRKKEKRDDSIMETNNSSIVSKRSVERLYYPEPHYFRYFVKKPQRRSPLINRGYWLRMHAVDVVIQKFLDEPTERKKIILNLGCGYDPVPFQWLAKGLRQLQNTLFIDVDYPALMARKCEIITSTAQLSTLIQPIDTASQSEATYLRSPHYLALGCDLANVKALDQHLASEIDLASCLVLCVAEVSITYMNTEAADALISWAGQQHAIRFCLLEQYLPDGADHPFAQKMIQHFNNLQTPLRSIQCYPRLTDQQRRFTDAGWRSAVAISLWDLWSDPSFVSAKQRLALNRIEPFDEWEEFALFASHYFLLEASSHSRTTSPVRDQGETDIDFQNGSGWTKKGVQANFIIQAGKSQQTAEHRRFGAVVKLDLGMFGCHGGLGDQRRLNTTSVYNLGTDMGSKKSLPPNEIEPRMCHTITHLGDGHCLLVGGRTSPDRGLSDCWLGQGQIWQRIEDLPRPLYRHSAVTATSYEADDSVVIFGGRTTGSKLSDSWLLWHKSTGFVQVDAPGETPEPRFGAAMSATGVSHGILLGGMAYDGTIYQDIWQWEIVDIDTHARIRAKNVTNTLGSGGLNLLWLCRVGAALVQSLIGPLLIGGVTAKQLLPQEANIICLSNSLLAIKESEKPDCRFHPLKSFGNTRRPLLVGHSVYSSDSHLVITGGGAVCFSFGTFWNEGFQTLQSGENLDGEVWAPLLDQKPALPDPGKVEHVSQGADLDNRAPLSRKTPQAVPYTKVETALSFERISNNGKPVIMVALDLGVCTTSWSMENLKRKIGEDRPVIVHESSSQHMNFQTKNFKYCTKRFGEFVDQITTGSMQYLRSLATERPSAKAANLAADFPQLALDFKLPPQLESVERNAHSSPLRISGPVTMWLHYDVMANVLCQINGSKRILLFPPSDVSNFQIAPGESSSSINVFTTDLSRFPQCQEAILKAGDVLFIPPLWLHATAPLETTSTSVNVFFRNLQTGYASGRDVYGNRDLQAYEKGRLEVAKIARTFNGLPGAVGRFYLERLADELRDQALTFRS